MQKNQQSAVVQPQRTVKRPYETPKLEQHQYTVVTGASLPVSANPADVFFSSDNES